MIKGNIEVENNGFFLTYLVLTIVAGCTVILCFLNKPIEIDNKLQSIVVSIFCISAALLYALYMIVSRLLYLILTYAENMNSRHSSNYEYVGDEEFTIDSEEDEENQLINCKNNTNSNNHYHNNEKINNRRRNSLPRNVVISSMYFGGSGAFLAISPLCMWDITVTASFIFSLILLSWFDCGKVAVDFKANVDTASVISNLKKLRVSMHLLIICTLCIVVGIDWLSFLPQSTSLEKHNKNVVGELSTNSLAFIIANYTKMAYENDIKFNNNNNIATTSHNEKKIVNGFVVDHNIHNSEFIIIKWPLILLAMTSPIMLRAGGGGGGQFRHCMSPSQTLETGLPVSTLLSILVLCWYSPSSIELIGHIQFGNISTIIPMLILCPPCISSTLIFLLRGFKTRMSYVPSLVITCILVIRQQINRKFQNYMDWMSIISASMAIITLIAFFIYQKKVSVNQNENNKNANVKLAPIAKNVPPSSPKNSINQEKQLVNYSVLVLDNNTLANKNEKTKEENALTIYDKKSKTKKKENYESEVDDYDEFFYSESGEIIELNNGEN